MATDKCANLDRIDGVPISFEEETLIRNWRVLCERDRMEFYRVFEREALKNRDAGPLPVDHLKPASARFQRQLGAMLRGGGNAQRHEGR